jgi:drug/metabolite transporter (DMT)-like permease
VSAGAAAGAAGAEAGRGGQLRATLLVAFAACCFGSIGVLTVLATRAGTSLATVLAWRYALGAALLLVAAGGPARLRLPRGQGARALLLGGGGQAAVAFLSLSSLRWISAAALGFLFYTFPAWVTLFAALRGSERVGARRAVALALSLGGIALMVGSPWSAPMPLPGVALALGAAVVYALYIPLLDGLQTGTTPAVTSTYVTAGAALLFVAGAALEGTLTAALPAVAWLSVALLALVCTALAFIAFLRGLGVLGPVRTAIVSTVEPFFTALLGAAVLGQPLTPPMLAGGALIAAAVVLLQLPPRGARAGAPEHA